MLSLRELRRAARVIREGILDARLRRITRPDENTLILTFETPAEKAYLLISVHPEFARICLTDSPGPAARMDSFCEYVRAHLTGGRLSGIDVPGEQRHIRMNLPSRSGAFECIFSILGARSNVYLLNGEGKLLHSLRPLEETRRELKIGEHWLEPRGTAPTEGTDRWDVVPDAIYLEEIGRTYNRLEQERKAERLARRMENAVKKERLFLQRKCLNLQEDLGEAQKAETYRHKGELLKGILHSVKPGDKIAWAKDHRTGEVVEIPLDPRQSPAANMESYFVRYQKGSRGAKMVQQQLEELESALTSLDQIEGRLTDLLEAEAPDLSAVETLTAQPAVHRLINRHSGGRGLDRRPAKPAIKRGPAARLLPKRYRTEEGLEIWVGRSDEGNDYLTTRLARGNDLFFHLEGYPGSHVILRTGGCLNPPPSSVLDACELAAHFSKLKASGSADVHVAPVKDVKKPKGAKPGLVFVRKGKTIHLRRDARRLQSILASRLED